MLFRERYLLPLRTHVDALAAGLGQRFREQVPCASRGGTRGQAGLPAGIYLPPENNYIKHYNRIKYPEKHLPRRISTLFQYWAVSYFMIDMNFLKTKRVFSTPSFCSRMSCLEQIQRARAEMMFPLVEQERFRKTQLLRKCWWSRPGALWRS